MARKYSRNDGEGGIGEATPHREAITFGAPSPVAIAPFVEQGLIPFPTTLDGKLGCAQWRRRRDSNPRYPFRYN